MPPVASPTDAPSCLAVVRRALVEARTRPLIVYGVDLYATNRDHPFGRETFTSRADAERFIDEVRAEDPALARSLRIEERELGPAGLN